MLVGLTVLSAGSIVDYTRGAEVSRPFNAILEEARALVDGGAREITLLGQNVNAWQGGGGRGLDHLIRALDALPGLERIRYTTSHPNDMTDGLIRAHAEVEKLMPFLHLPVQAGSDRVLRAMNRSHTADSYLRLLDRFRAARPDIAISGDFIVGFPGESEADFQEQLRQSRWKSYPPAFAIVAEKVEGATRPQAGQRQRRLPALVVVIPPRPKPATMGRAHAPGPLRLVGPCVGRGGEGIIGPRPS